MISGDRLDRLVYFSGVIVMFRRRRTLSSIMLVIISCTKDIVGRNPELMRLLCRNYYVESLTVMWFSLSSNVTTSCAWPVNRVNTGV